MAIIGGISNYNITYYCEYNVSNFLPLEAYSDVDAYVVMANPHVARTLGYYVTEEPIYYGEKPSAMSPANNRFSIDDFSSKRAEKIILLLDVDDMPSNNFTAEYNYEYLGEWKCEDSVDAFLLIKK